MSRRALGVVAVSALAATLLASCGEPDAADTAESFLSAWQDGQETRAAKLTDAEPSGVGKALTDAFAGVDADKLRLRLGEVDEREGKATAEFRATVRLRALDVDWSYQGRLPLVESDGRWRVDWSPAVVHPSLRKATWSLDLNRQLPERAPILDREGSPLVRNEPVVVVGVVPADLKDRAKTLQVLHREVDLDPKETAAQIDKAPEKGFLPLITLRYDDYREVKGAIHDLPGVRFQSKQLPLAKERQYARQLLGTVGPISAERLKELGAPYQAADDVGNSGLQAAYERRLAGIPEGWVSAVDEKGVKRKSLAHLAGREGSAVKTTVDASVQDAAEAALDTVGKPAALVAVRPSTGEVLAVANRPVDDSFDRALVGRYPPGSTFKVVTTTALLDHTSVSPDTTVPCPPTITAGGKSFRNFEGEAAGDASFREDFAMSCNTAFIEAASKLDDGDLAKTAESYGFGAEYALGLPSYAGSVPSDRDAAERAAHAIGQGRVLASPLTMAGVAGAVADGTWHPPTLVRSPEQKAKAKPTRLDPDDARTLRSLMRSVVTSGTAKGLAGSGQVAGKTGTAEYGSDDPPRTHAWFIGYRGDLAFSVLVEDGGVGGEAAVPVAKTFLAGN